MVEYKINSNLLYKIFLISLPFTHALTINLFFPLKISEIFLLLIILYKAISIKKIKMLTKVDMSTFFLVAFGFIASISFIVNIFWHYDYPLKKIPFRISLPFDSFIKLIYVGLNLYVFFLFKNMIKNGHINVIKYWVIGALIASFYAWYIFVASGFGLPYFKLIGMDEIPQNMFGFVRSGTFKEGNYMGMYLLLSSVLAFYQKYNKAGWFFLLTILTTFSSISIISALAILIVVLIQNNYLTIKNSVIIFPALLIGLILFINTNLFQRVISKKIFTPSNEITMDNMSKIDRMLTARIGFYEGINNPILGVGPYNYGYHYDQYNDIEQKIVNLSKGHNDFFKRINRRAIANNVYMEVWSEYGIISFVVLMMFFVKIIKNTYKKDYVLFAGTLGLMLSFNAFPSFIMLFIWTYLSIIMYYEKQVN